MAVEGVGVVRCQGVNASGRSRARVPGNGCGYVGIPVDQTGVPHEDTIVAIHTEIGYQSKVVCRVETPVSDKTILATAEWLVHVGADLIFSSGIVPEPELIYETVVVFRMAPDLVAHVEPVVRIGVRRRATGHFLSIEAIDVESAGGVIARHSHMLILALPQCRSGPQTAAPGPPVLATPRSPSPDAVQTFGRSSDRGSRMRVWLGTREA